MTEHDFCSGFVAIVGRPNVGKSTLLNRIAGSKIAIVSEKPQTTRMRIRGVLTRPDCQMIFVDTPGFHKPKGALGEKLNTMVISTIGEVDVILFMMDASQGVGKGDAFLAGQLKDTDAHVIGLLNKIDLTSFEEIARQREKALELYEFLEIIEISATIGTNVDYLIDRIANLLPHGPMYFPPEMISDQSEKTVVAELIREKALELTREEVPHSVAVLVEEMRERQEKDLVEIEAVIYVEKESQKGIIVGKGGKMIKEIGTRARRDIEAALGKHVYLDLRVKVEKDWSKKPQFIRKLEYS